MSENQPSNSNNNAKPARIILITGMSGAGRSATLKVLEDIGYEAIDNLPLYLLQDVLKPAQMFRRPIAIGIDVRTRDFNVEHVLRYIHQLREDKAPISLVFLDCDDTILINRFTETRRRHPLAIDRPVGDGIKQERSLLAPLQQQADIILNTSDLSLADLRRQVHGHFAFAIQSGISFSVMSFAYRYGIPREADIVTDVRFLVNPHYNADLRPLTGKDELVGDFIEQDPDFESFFIHLQQLLQPLLPRYQAEGKNYLTFAFGCTGGRHRSVYVATRFAQWLQQTHKRVTLYHRDLEKLERGEAA
jgi:UPF0042 nucleotide-binding protein